jgi:hypothetical protein
VSKQRQTPHLRPETDRLAGERRDQLAAELRANLARRKAQSRERAAEPAVGDKAPGQDNGPA